MAEKNLINLAKGKPAAKPAVKKTTPKKPAAKPVVKEPTPEEVRDLKAKETVEKLLEDSPLTTLNKKDELLEFDENPPEASKGVEWLEEQVALLTEKNEALKAELALAKEDIQKLEFDVQQGRVGGASNEGEVKTAVLQLFNEIQENHIKLGVNEQGVGNFRIYCPGFLNRMIKFFPFLDQHKRYQ